MATQGQDVAHAIDRLGDKIVEAATTIAASLGLVAIALSGVAAAIRPPARHAGETQ